MGRRRKRRRSQGDVELNLAAMLDMAFQLLAFFILTFKPAPFEGQIALQMPDPRPLAKVESGKAVGADTTNNDPLLGLDTIVVTALSTDTGEIAGLRIGEGEPTSSLRTLEDQLSAAFADPGAPFEQVILHVGSKLRYEHLMQLMDVCTRITLPSGQKLQKLSFVELPDGGG